jgi:hypothetical protein
VGSAHKDLANAPECGQSPPYAEDHGQASTLAHATRSAFCLTVIALFLVAFNTQAADKVDFNREVRPILAGKCFQCHGHDEAARKAKLRLDVRDVAIKPLEKGEIAIVPGKADHSELIKRITTDDDDDIMPPSKNSAPLTAAQIATLKKWINQGAPYTKHWAYIKPVRPALPAVKNTAWPKNEIDRFILARLESEGLTPEKEADRYALIRRVSIDLTGLPPSVKEADAFAGDTDPNAYEKLVDRLLASPAYGERWAAMWLDLARYADSQGYANDPDRTIWRWRDWLIQALNRNEPYDQFSTDMLAGDLLPNPTPDQIIATGFHRNTLTNTEGGTTVEEFRSAAIVDRVNTTMSVWNATTMMCCQCHSHKYDPFTQTEYYELFAVFNNTEDNNRADDAPTVEAPRVGQEKEAARIKLALADVKKKLDEETKKIDTGRAEWEKTVKPESLPKDIAAILKKPAKDRKKDEEKLTAYYRANTSPEFKKLNDEYKKLEAQHKALVITTPVMKEGKPRQTHIHLRGNYMALGDKVQPALPAVFPAPPKGEPINRLALARWFFNPDHPLTARVAANRLWEEIFGIGIVETSEDFGTQGEPPSHPELLDWLATEYIQSGWDTKHMLKLMVMSAAYRQTSAVSEDLDHRDPMNRLLARGPRVRLSAEEIRDQSLFASGLLSTKMFGPPCQPPKPNFGLSAAFGGTTDWKADTGEERWRRALYIRIRRNAPYPSMSTFDATDRTYCTIRRGRTNTPLQALVTLNDPCYVEAAQALARKTVAEGGATTGSRVTFAFRRCLTRPPSPKETQRLVQLFQTTLEQYEHSPKQAEEMATKPLGPAPKGANIKELAAWTVVSNVLLNLDETLAKR